MEGSESEAIFDSLNLNPQLFINAALNIFDELIQSAFDHLHQEASTQLMVNGSDRAEDLTKGLDYIRNIIQSALDKRLTMWEKYCFLHIFVVPEGFSLPKDDEACDGDIMDVEAVGNLDLDAQLDSLRTKLNLAEQESAKLKREIQALERQSFITNHQAASIKELMKLSEQISEDDAFKELQKLATELRPKIEKLQTQRADDIQRARLERLSLWNGDLFKMIGGNGLSNARPEEIEGFLSGRELALMNACKQVFPNAARLLCRVHINRNILKNCRSSIRPQHDWEFFISQWSLLVESSTCISYMENYNQLHSLLIRYSGVLNYIDQVWLNKYKEMFASAWIDRHLNFGNRTTNRVESLHAILKKYLLSANSTLDKFIGRIDQLMKSQHTTIEESFEKSIIYRKNEHNLLCFKLLHGFVSHEALDMVAGELEHLNSLQLDSSNCGCQLRNSCGLPCARVLSMYLNSGQCIPLESIDIFWRKLDLSPSTSMQNEMFVVTMN